MEYLLHPEREINDETVDWCRWLVGGGRTHDEFCHQVQEHNNTVMCGLVWTANFVAFRCQTCRISQCMSLCEECFRHGNHEGHDYYMFRSQAGGACDCGDPSVLRESSRVSVSCMYQTKLKNLFYISLILSAWTKCTKIETRRSCRVDV